MNQFNTFVESMKRLYVNGNVSKDKINSLFFKGKITKEEKEYILNAH